MEHENFTVKDVTSSPIFEKEISVIIGGKKEHSFDEASEKLLEALCDCPQDEYDQKILGHVKKVLESACRGECDEEIRPHKAMCKFQVSVSNRKLAIVWDSVDRTPDFETWNFKEFWDHLAACRREVDKERLQEIDEKLLEDYAAFSTMLPSLIAQKTLKNSIYAVLISMLLLERDYLETRLSQNSGRG